MLHIIYVLLIIGHPLCLSWTSIWFYLLYSQGILTKLVRKSLEGQGIIFAKIFVFGSWALLDCHKAQFSPFNDININQGIENVFSRHPECLKFKNLGWGLIAPPCCFAQQSTKMRSSKMRTYSWLKCFFNIKHLLVRCPNYGKWYLRR